VKFLSIANVAHVYVTVRVTYAGRQVFRAGLTEDRSSPGNLWNHWNFTSQTAGQYTLSARVSAAGRTVKKSTSFEVEAAPLSFRFDRLQTFHANGQPAIIFTHRERVLIVATYTISNAPSMVSVTVLQNLEAPAAGGYKPLGRPVVNIFDAGNGRHTYTVSFVPQGSYNLLRMVIDLTVAGKTSERAVSFELRG
jgi:hypothetical protein